MKSIISVSIIVLICGGAFAQNFATRFQAFSKHAPSFVTLTSGETISGHYVKAKRKKGLFKTVTFEDTVAGVERVLPAGEIASMRLVPSELGRVSAALDATQSISRIGNSDMNSLSTDFVYFQQAQLPDRKATMVLLQKVNPGFDSKIEVFDDPWAQETAGVGLAGVAITGGNLKSYYLIKDGVAMKIEKSRYKRGFSDIYGDCPALAEEFPRIEWTDFSKHVAAHEQVCE